MEIFSTHLRLLYSTLRGGKHTTWCNYFSTKFISLASVAGGSKHPLVTLAKDWATFGLSSEIVLGLCTAAADAQGRTDPALTADSEFEDVCHYEADFENTCEVLGVNYSLQEAEYAFCRALMLTPRAGSFERGIVQNLNKEMAGLYLAPGAFAKAASMVSDVPSMLAEWIEKGWTPTIPRTAPVSMIQIVRSLAIFAKAHVGLEDHDSAEKILSLCTWAAGKYLHNLRNTLAKIEAQTDYARYLVSRGRREEAGVFERTIDMKLKEYTLD